MPTVIRLYKAPNKHKNDAINRFNNTDNPWE